MIAYTKNTAETEQMGKSLACLLEEAGARRAFIAMRGEMGVGKTAFTRGFCSHFGISAVKSPTYTIVNEYRGRVSVFHFDTYRIDSEDDLCSTGYEDYIAKDGYVICEWSEKIEDFIPDEAITVTITKTDGADGRKIEIKNEPEVK